jgi:hypothetical protein
MTDPSQPKNQPEPETGLVVRPAGQLHDYPIDARWEITRRHPYFRDNINKIEIQESISGLSRRLHHEESANIMIFLCHLSKDERVLGAMLEAAKGLFADSPHYDINKQNEFLNRVNEELPKLALDDASPTENRQRLLEQQDARRRIADADKKEEPAELDEPDDEINELAQINAAIKTIRILGQVLRNFSGSLKGDPKRQLVEACYGLGLRVLGRIFNMVEESLPDLAKLRVYPEMYLLTGLDLRYIQER